MLINLPISNKITSNDKTINFQDKFIYIMIFYTFVYSNIVRLMVGNLLHLNLLYSILPSLLIITYYIFFYRRVNYLVLYFVMFILLLNLISIINFHIQFSTTYRFISGILIPLLLIGIQLEKVKLVIKNFIKIYNWLIIVNVIFGFIDYLSGKKLQFILANLLYPTHYYNSVQNDVKSGIFRMFSLLGHPLTNTLLVIIFISINLAYYHYYKKKAHISLYVVYLVTIVGALLCNSKLGLGIIGAILLSTVVIGKKKGRNLFFIAVSSIGALSIESIRENVVKRFLIASERGDLTNGRLSALDALSGNHSLLPNNFIGKGIGSSDTLLQSVSSLNNIEIPFIMYMYDYGIFSTILIYVILYLLPVFILIRNKHFYLFFLFTMIFLFANSYNGLATSIGIVQIVTFITMLLINLSNSLKLKVVEKRTDWR